MAIQTAADSITSNQGSPYGFKNRVINGAMVIDQRNAGANSSTTNIYTLDRWITYASQSSKFTWGQNLNSVTPPDGFINYLGVQSSSSYSVSSSDYFVFDQCIEGYNVADLGWGQSTAKSVTLSFWVRSSLTGTFGGSVQNSAGNRAYGFSYTINSANTWEYKTVTIAGDTTGTWLTNNGIGIRLRFGLGVGSSLGNSLGWQAASGNAPTGSVSVVGTNSATWYITGVQLEKGTQATAFDYIPVGAELVLCQRYFTKSQSWAGAVGSTEGQGLIAWYAVTTAVAAGWASHKVSMRTQPTITIYKQDGTINATNRFIDGAAVTGTTTCPEPGIEGFRYVSNASGGFTAGTYYQFYYTASAEL